ncbi:hypothetical protein ACROYT_G022001 [Oculina patagonica]
MARCSLFSLFILLCAIFKENVTTRKNLFISRASGNDSWSCDQEKPCKTIWRAVTLASHGDHIHLDGTNTEKDPYTCQSMTPQHPGIYINKSLSLIGLGPRPQIRCANGTWLTFDGSDNTYQMEVTLSKLLVKETFVLFRDASAEIRDSEFEGNREGVKFLITNRLVSNIQFTNSTFVSNSECISIVVNGTNKLSQTIQVTVRMNDSSFDANVMRNNGSCISFLGYSYNNQSVSCDITLDNVTFSRNTFSPTGLVFSELKHGIQNFHLQDVTFLDNSPLTSRDVLTGYPYSECIIRSTTANMIVNASNFMGQNARSFQISASNISLQIYNSSFRGHKVEGNGGITSMTGTDYCKLNVFNSSFVNTTAVHGGAFNIKCVKVEFSFLHTIFSGNKATFGNGGAVNIDAAVGSIQLRHSRFTSCNSYFNGGALSVDSSAVDTKEDADLHLSIDSSRFLSCRAGFYGGSIIGIDMQISINNSHFTSNYATRSGGAIYIHRAWRINASQITVENSTFSDNVAKEGSAISLMMVFNGAIFILKKATIESNTAQVYGAVAIQNIFALKVSQSRFLKNMCDVFNILDVNIVEVEDSYFEGLTAPSTMKEAERAFSLGGISSISRYILITNTTFTYFTSEREGGAIYLTRNGGKAHFVVRKSRFVDNISFQGEGGALFLGLEPDIQNDPGCTSVFKHNDFKNYPSWDYKSFAIIEDSTFERNAAAFGGAIHVANGNVTLRNCYFVDNFAKTEGGHIYTVAGSGSVKIQDSLFHQTMNQLLHLLVNGSKTSFIHAESSGEFTISNTTMDARPYSRTTPLMLVVNGRQIDVGNSTQLYCPVGSEMEILNFTDQVTTLHNNRSCTIQVTTLQFSCSACKGNTYSLQRGRALGSHLVPGFQCLPCPFGANCTQNIVARSNFWGFKQQINPPTLQFAMCPVGYCNPAKRSDFPEYNGCQGNRSGELCGRCCKGYTETLYSTHCRSSHQCNDGFGHWWYFMYFSWRPTLHLTLLLSHGSSVKSCGSKKTNKRTKIITLTKVI